MQRVAYYAQAIAKQYNNIRRERVDIFISNKEHNIIKRAMIPEASHTYVYAEERNKFINNKGHKSMLQLFQIRPRNLIFWHQHLSVLYQGLQVI
jgi:hypothetical protein